MRSGTRSATRSLSGGVALWARRFAACALVLGFALALPATSQAITELIDSSGDGLGNTLNTASAIEVDDAGNVYVSGRETDNVFRIAPDGTITEIIDSQAAGYRLEWPVDLALDEAGDVSRVATATTCSGLNRTERSPRSSISPETESETRSIVPRGSPWTRRVTCT